MSRLQIMKERRQILLPAIIGGALLLAFPLFGNNYYIHVANIIFLNIVLATSYRVLYVTGLGSFCHVTFYSIGAYTSALLTVKMGLPFGVGFLAGGLLAAGVAAILGLVAVKTRGAYFFMITFALFSVTNIIAIHWKDLTGGYTGLVSIPGIMGIGGVIPNYYMIMAFTAGMVFVLYRLDRSRFGQELIAIGDSDILSEAIGINVFRYRVLAFSIGALIAGFAGSMYAHYQTFINPLCFTMFSTIYIIVWCVVGGYRKLWGPVVGAVIMTVLSEALHFSAELQAILYSIILLIFVMLMPRGVVGLVDDLRTKLRRRRQIASAISLGRDR